MIKDFGQYNLFLEFVKTYSPVGFKGIDRNDHLILALEEMTRINNQFYCIFDLINMRNEFTSGRCLEMFGIHPEELTSYHFKEATHPDDHARHILGLNKLFRVGDELFIAEKGEAIVSSNFRMRDITGNYSNQLIQCYLFFSKSPVKTVYLFHVNTDISWFKKLKHGFHYYAGNDLSYFRYPDEKLLLTGSAFTGREFEIIRLIQSGLSSEQIGEKLFLSRHTVNTHRKNILNKTKKAHISDLLFDLREHGLL
jgi:DNA-binding CsgD family transcriptional regulator